MSVNQWFVHTAAPLAPGLCSEAGRPAGILLGETLTQDLLFQCVLQALGNKDQISHILQKVHFDKATSRKDRSRQQCVSSDFMMSGFNNEDEFSDNVD